MGHINLYPLSLMGIQLWALRTDSAISSYCFKLVSNQGARGYLLLADKDGSITKDTRVSSLLSHLLAAINFKQEDEGLPLTQGLLDSISPDDWVFEMGEVLCYFPHPRLPLSKLVKLSDPGHLLRHPLDKGKIWRELIKYFA